MAAGGLAQEVPGQQQHVVAARAQRGHVHGHDGQAVVEVLAKAALLDRHAQIPVGRRDDADIGVQRLDPADPLEGALLQHAQHADLQRGRHLADLVQQEGAAVGQLEAAAALALRPGERAAFVAEQLGLQQPLGQRAAVQRNKGPVGAAGAGVQQARHDLLAGAALAGDQDGGVGAGDALDGAHDRRHRVRGVQQQRAIFGRRLVGLLAAVAHRARHDHAQLFGVVQGLAEVVERALLHRVDGVGHRAVGGDQQHHGRRHFLLQRGQQGAAVHHRHADVAEHDVERRLAGQLEGGPAVAGVAHLVAVVGEHPHQEPAEGGLIVDHQDPAAADVAGFTASRTVKRHLWLRYRLPRCLGRPRTRRAGARSSSCRGPTRCRW